ncbi:vanadium-dependent haloperoxidase [Nonomuraea sp. 3N208]|uniref:vanadium-dependent haloperoxidase n=1 Tax=Nonomuraea sp. 3N208 TaxID=3457421 RepID=UPI003FCE9184
MQKQRFSRTIAVAAALSATVSAVVPLAAPTTAHAAPAAASADVVLEWNRYAVQMVNRLEIAMVQGAVYDAVNAITRTNQPYLVTPPARPWYSAEAAAATAAYRTMIALLPERQPELKSRYERSLSTIHDDAAKRGGVKAGEQAAEAMLAAREGDGRNGTRQPAIGTEPGQWRPTPPNYTVAPTAWLGDVKPFLIPSAEQLRTRGPNALTSTAYAKDFAEVKKLGAADSPARTPEQTDVARYWDQAPWDDIVRSLAQSRKLNAAETARLLAMVYLAAADSQIACVNDKNHWNWWRPVTAIRDAASDGNPATRPNRKWTPLLETPGFAEHAAGHTCGSAAIAGALQTFFGTDTIAFSATSSSSGTTRRFTSFSQALDEVIDSRVWGGVHFRTADVQGARLGKEVARWEAANYFRPVSR